MENGIDCCLCPLKASSESELEKHISIVHANIFRGPEKISDSTTGGAPAAAAIGRVEKMTPEEDETWRKMKTEEQNKMGNGSSANGANLNGSTGEELKWNQMQQFDANKAQKRRSDEQVAVDWKRKRNDVDTAGFHYLNSKTTFVDPSTDSWNATPGTSSSIPANYYTSLNNGYNNPNIWTPNYGLQSPITDAYNQSTATVQPRTSSLNSNPPLNDSNSSFLNIDPVTVMQTTDAFNGEPIPVESNGESQAKTYQTLQSVFHTNELSNVSYETLLSDSVHLFNCDSESFSFPAQFLFDQTPDSAFVNSKKQEESSSQNEGTVDHLDQDVLHKCVHCTFQTKSNILFNSHLAQNHGSDMTEVKNRPPQGLASLSAVLEDSKQSLIDYQILNAESANAEVESTAHNIPYSHSNPFHIERSTAADNSVERTEYTKPHFREDYGPELSGDIIGKEPARSEQTSSSPSPDNVKNSNFVTVRCDPEEKDFNVNSKVQTEDVDKRSSRTIVTLKNVSLALEKPDYNSTTYIVGNTDVTARKTVPTTANFLSPVVKNTQLQRGCFIVKTANQNLSKTLKVIPGITLGQKMMNISSKIAPTAKSTSISKQQHNYLVPIIKLKNGQNTTASITVQKPANCPMSVESNPPSIRKEPAVITNLVSSSSVLTTEVRDTSTQGQHEPEPRQSQPGEVDTVEGLPEDIDVTREADVSRDVDATGVVDVSREVDATREATIISILKELDPAAEKRKKAHRRPRNWRLLLIQKLEELMGSKSKELGQPLTASNDDNSNQYILQEFTKVKDSYMTKLKDDSAVEGSMPPEVLQLLKFENQVQLEKEKNRKLTYELSQLRKLKDIKIQWAELNKEHQTTQKCLEETKNALIKTTQQLNQKNAVASVTKISEERCDWEKKKTQRELDSMQEHLSSIRSTVAMILKRDAEFCGSAVDNDIINNEDLVEMVNSILCQFGKSKQRHYKEVQNCLVEMTDLKTKKMFYKKVGLQMKEKVKLLETENRDLKVKFEEKSVQLEQEIADKNGTRSDLEGVINAKDKQILKLTEQMKAKHEEFQKHIDLLKIGIEKKFEGVKRDRNQLAELKIELEAKITGLEDENKHLKIVEMNLKNEVELLESKLTDNKLKVKVKVLEEQVESKNKEIEELKQMNEKESKRLNLKFKREKTELEKMKTSLEKEVKIKSKAVEDLQQEVSELKCQIDGANSMQKMAQCDANEISNLQSELKEKNSILEVVQRSNFLIEARSKNLTAVHRKAMSQYKMSLDMMKEKVLTKIHAKNEKINEIYLELKSKEVQLNSVRQQLNEKDAIIAAMESKKLPR